jgi:hypothetical protein
MVFLSGFFFFSNAQENYAPLYIKQKKEKEKNIDIIICLLLIGIFWDTLTISKLGVVNKIFTN